MKFDKEKFFPFFIVLTVILLVSVGAFLIGKVVEGDSLIRINDGGGILGEPKANISIFLDNKIPVAGLQFEMTYPDFLEVKEVVPTKRMPQPTVIVSNNDTIGKFSVASLVFDEIAVEKGPIMKVVFNIPKNSPKGIYDLTFSNVVIGDIDSNPIPFDITNGVFIVASDEKELRDLEKEQEREKGDRGGSGSGGGGGSVRDEDVRKNFVTEDGESIEIDKKVEIEDDRIKIRIYRKTTNSQGDVDEIVILIDKEDGRRKIKIEGREDLEVDTDLEIKSDFEENESGLIVLDSRGDKHIVDVMPDRIEEIVQSRFSLREDVSISNIELKEIRDRNIPKVVYNVQTNQNGKFLGIFNIRIRLNSEIDPETGEVIRDIAPWWAFLVHIPGEIQ